MSFSFLHECPRKLNSDISIVRFHLSTFLTFWWPVIFISRVIVFLSLTMTMSFKMKLAANIIWLVYETFKRVKCDPDTRYLCQTRVTLHQTTVCVWIVFYSASTLAIFLGCWTASLNMCYTFLLHSDRFGGEIFFSLSTWINAFFSNIHRTNNIFIAFPRRWCVFESTLNPMGLSYMPSRSKMRAEWDHCMGCRGFFKRAMSAVSQGDALLSGTFPTSVRSWEICWVCRGFLSLLVLVWHI